MFFRAHFQNAYVTHDFDKAKKVLSDAFGLEDWILFDADMQLKTPHGIEASAAKVGLVWQGGHQIELIQPVSGWYPHYAAFLPDDTADATPRFHHACVRRDDLDAMRREIDELGIPVAFEGTVEDGNGGLAMVYIYLDARETIGHFLEFIWATPETWAGQGWPSEKPVF